MFCVPETRVIITFDASDIKTGAASSDVIFTPLNIRRTVPFEEELTWILPSSIVPLIRYVPGDVISFVFPDRLITVHVSLLY